MNRGHALRSPTSMHANEFTARTYAVSHSCAHRFNWCLSRDDVRRRRVHRPPRTLLHRPRPGHDAKGWIDRERPAIDDCGRDQHAKGYAMTIDIFRISHLSRCSEVDFPWVYLHVTSHVGNHRCTKHRMPARVRSRFQPDRDGMPVEHILIKDALS